jgi:hypothetical protein
MKEGSVTVPVGLDAVAWAKIEHAYGPAVDVPDLIRALVSPDAKIRGGAWYQLHGNLWHQGTIYEATAYAVPFFLQLLKSEKVPGKQEILIYLARLFLGRSYWDVHKDLTSSRQEVAKPQFAETLRTELSWVDATKQAIRVGRETYLQLLQGRDIGPRIAAAYLLGLIGESENEILEQIAESSEGVETGN